MGSFETYFMPPKRGMVHLKCLRSPVKKMNPYSYKDWRFILRPMNILKLFTYVSPLVCYHEFVVTAFEISEISLGKNKQKLLRA